MTDKNSKKLAAAEKLKSLQQKYPMNNGDGKEYDKYFFAKLDKAVKAYKSFWGLNQANEEAQAHKQSALQTYQTKTGFAAVIPFLKFKIAAFNAWRTERAKQNALKKTRIAVRAFALEKLKQSTTLDTAEVKNEIAVLSNVFNGSALKVLQAKLNSKNKAPRDFYSTSMLEEYAFYRIYDQSLANEDIKKYMSKEYKPLKTKPKAPKYLDEQAKAYIQNPQNQWRVTVMVASKIHAALTNEIKKLDKIILQLKARIAELKSDNVKFSDGPLRYVQVKFDHAWYYLRLGFAKSTITETNVQECSSKIDWEAKGIDRCQSLLIDLKKDMPLLRGFSSTAKQHAFMETIPNKLLSAEVASDVGNAYWELPTELEQETYKHAIAVSKPKSTALNTEAQPVDSRSFAGPAGNGVVPGHGAKQTSTPAHNYSPQQVQ